MDRFLRIALFIALLAIPVAFYSTLEQRKGRRQINLPMVKGDINGQNPKIALVFDDLGDSLQDLENIYSLNIPVSVSVIPGLKFSKNIAHIASRCGFSVFIRLPFEYEARDKPKISKYGEFSHNLTQWEVESLLRYYLNSIRIAIGINVNMNYDTKKDYEMAAMVIDAAKKRGMVFIDNAANDNQMIYNIAKKENLRCGYGDAVLDGSNTEIDLEKQFEKIISLAAKKGKIIVIVVPGKETFSLLKENILPNIDRIDFITLKDYF
jgi:polysaccharide deacetylase 2 family uncharacterized protein YibQ